MDKNKKLEKYKKQTRLARTGMESDTQHGAIVPSICMSSTFSFEGLDRPRPYNYTRSGNPTRDLLGEAIAISENGEGAIITSSGMSAILCVLHLCKQGDVVLAPHDCYGSTIRLLDSYNDSGFLKIVYVDQTDPADLDRAFAENPAMVLIETPSNPLLRIADIKDICKRAKSCGAITVADNTFMSPALQNPIDLGADLVVHSTTKFINGHSDVTGGAVVAATPELEEKIFWWGNNLGLTGTPLDSFLTLRGMRTLDIRVQQSQKSAQKVAEFLNTHEKITTVNYPGLTSHKQHELAKKQQKGFGSMISFELDTDATGVQRFFDKIELFSLANSLGAIESLINHPYTMTHAACTPEAKAYAGISQSLIRLSIGLEDVDDLIENLKISLANI